MSIDYTTDTLLATLRLLPLMPAVQALFTNDNLLTIMTFEMNSKIIPLIDMQAEEYFIQLDDIIYDSSKQEYNIPTRCIGGKLRSVSFVDANNNEIRIPRLRPEDIMSNVNATGLAINPALWGFYLRNNTIHLYLSSTIGTAGNQYKFVRLRYCRQPNQLVETSDCGQITAINGNDITVETLPTTFLITETYDLISNVPPLFVSNGDDQTVTAINTGTNTITFTSVPDSLAIGDWVCLSGQSPIPQIPFNPGFDLLLQLSAAKCLEIHGDTQGFNTAMSQAKDQKDYFLAVVTPRVDGNVIRLTTPNALYNWDSLPCWEDPKISHIDGKWKRYGR